MRLHREHPRPTTRGRRSGAGTRRLPTGPLLSSVAHSGAPSYPGAMPRFRVAAAQLNVVVGDLEGNAARILEAYDAAEAAGCDLVVFPELTVTGYPPEDLLLRPAFVTQAGEMLEKIAARTA